MDVKTFSQKTIDLFIEHITGQFFLFIESRPELMKDYLNTIGDKNRTRKDVNMTLGGSIKKRLEMDNKLDSEGNMEREDNPDSVLCNSYTKHVKS